MKCPSGRLYLLFTPELCRVDPAEVLRDTLAGGVDLVQWRTSEGAGDIEQARDLCRAAGAPFIVNDDPRLAVRIGADGAHVGQQDMPAARAREILGPDRWLGVSTRNAAQVRAAVAAGADHVGLGPCFPTATKGYDEALPRAQITEALAASDLPVFAIGGIDADNLTELLALGVRRVAVCAAILAAPDHREATRRIAQALRRTGGDHTISMASPNE